MPIKHTRLRLILRFIKFALPFRMYWLGVAFFSLLGIVFGLVNPFLSKLIVDNALIKKDIRFFILISLIAGCVYLVTDLVNRINNALYRYIRMKVHFQLSKELFAHMQYLPFSWFKARNTGGHIYKLNYDIDNVSGFITQIMPGMVFVPLRIIFILIIVFFLSWKMALISLLLAPFLYLSSRYFAKRTRAMVEDLVSSCECIFSSLQETFSNIQLVKVFGKEKSSIGVFINRLIDNLKINFKILKLEAVSGFITEIFSKSTIGLIAFYGGYQVIKGELSLGSLTATMVYFAQLAGLENQMAGFFQTTAVGIFSCERIASILDEEKSEIEKLDTQAVLIKKAQVVFKGVSFGYENQKPILEGMNFTIPHSGRMALVGASGCGKTTLLCLILGLYQLWKGQILIDGCDIRRMKADVLKGQIGFAMQEPFLWNDSISNNIKYASEVADKSEIIKAAKLSGVDEFIQDLPDGYETIIGEHAVNLSEGQKQKIAIARALIKNPKILILDEAMSSMDSLSEEKIISNINQEYPQVTLISVSHRLSTVMNMEWVYYMRNPREILIDRALNLIKANPEFRDLFGKQGNP
ncbi:MAG: ABC transporter ATP-binding protein [Candidatus Omnitrophota bacterium]